MSSDNKNPMTRDDASRIQSGQANSGGDMSSGGFAARAQAAGDKNANAAAAGTGIGTGTGAQGGDGKCQGGNQGAGGQGNKTS